MTEQLQQTRFSGLGLLLTLSSVVMVLLLSPEEKKMNARL